MSFVPVFSVPYLHRALAPEKTPPGIAFVTTGLFLGAESREGPSAPPETLQAEESVRGAFPLPPREARAVLAEMLRLGEEHAKGGNVVMREAGFRDAFAAPETLNRREVALLEVFAVTGGNLGTLAGIVGGSVPADLDSEDASVQTALIACQKILLLAAELEERITEIRSASERYLLGERKLRNFLGSGEGSLGEPEAGRLFGLGGTQDLPWRTVVDAVLAFLPRNAVLFTSHAGMARDLREAGMLHPMPEDRVALCPGWPESLISGLLWGHLPAWRLVGRTSPAVNRPWLTSDIEILVARPKGGWTS